ncbi:hypothetical protein Hanom_Chr04g00360821 [Helianthus anomalus]
MDGVNKPDENGKISNLLDPDAKKQTFGRKSQNWPNLRDIIIILSKPQGRKWHFTLNKYYLYRSSNRVNNSIKYMCLLCLKRSPLN